jgi:putative ABC transport system permease protein
VIAWLRQLSWPELRHHPWRAGAAFIAVLLGVALAFSVHLINQSALGEFSAAVRSINGEPDFELRGPAAGFDEALYARVAAHPRVAVASPIVEIETAAFDPQGRRVPLRVLGIDALVAGTLAPALLPRVARRTGPLCGHRSGDDLSQSAGASSASARTRSDDRCGADAARPGRMAGRRRHHRAGPPLAVVDIAGAQAAFGRLGRLHRIDVRLVRGPTVRRCCASSRCRRACAPPIPTKPRSASRTCRAPTA